MAKIEFGSMSIARKTCITIASVLYILAVLGNARHGFVEILSVTLAFGALLAMVLLWVK
ncbi:MAG: hypothetical protein PHV77_06940 [Candidatus Omnitrophica bacterium]|nr:hypothetical protein [Candidatus Omnitrophota bacterium]